MVVATLRRVGLWLIGWGVHYPICRSFGLSADVDGAFLLFGNVVPIGSGSFGRDIRQVVAFDICVSSDFVQYVVSPSSDLYMRESTIAAISGL